MTKLVCNNCKNISDHGLMKGNGWIEVVLWLAYLIPGVIYSIWRRSGEKTVCPICKKDKLVPVKLNNNSGLRDCEWCAEPIKLEAKVCKHCKKEVEPLPLNEDNLGVFLDTSDAEDESTKNRLNRRLIILLSFIFVIFFSLYSQIQYNEFLAKQESTTIVNPTKNGTDNLEISTICKYSISAIFGRDPSIINAIQSGDIVYLQYSRPDDGKIWKSKCKVLNNSRVMWASNNSGDTKRWRDHDMDSKVFYRKSNNEITITEVHYDKSKSVKTFSLD